MKTMNSRWRNVLTILCFYGSYCNLSVDLGFRARQLSQAGVGKSGGKMQFKDRVQETRLTNVVKYMTGTDKYFEGRLGRAWNLI